MTRLIISLGRKRMSLVFENKIDTTNFHIILFHMNTKIESLLFTDNAQYQYIPVGTGAGFGGAGAGFGGSSCKLKFSVLMICDIVLIFVPE